MVEHNFKNFTEMKSTKSLSFLGLLSFIILFSQCEKQNLNIENDVASLEEANFSNVRTGVETKAYSDDELVLGKKLEIPYKLSIVEKSQNALKVKNKGYKPIKIEENYYYGRLLPKDEEEYDLINSDSTINTFDHPLDYEIIKQGNKFKDPQFKNSKYSYIYCVIPKDKTFKNIKFEILEKLYIPFGSGANDKMSKKLEKQEDANLASLDEEILISTGFKQKNKNAKIASWYPSGRITVRDYTTNNDSYDIGTSVPVFGCTVRSTKALVVTHSTLTDNNGYFRINESYWNISSVNYSIKWERSGFDIRSGSYGQAYFNGPHLSGPWNLDISRIGTPENYLYAHAHRAAERYYYHSSDYGIKPPPSVNTTAAYGVVGQILSHRMHLGVTSYINYIWPFNWLEKTKNRGHYFDFNDNWFASEINLPFPTLFNSKDIFATTIHELAHASHWSFGFTTADYTLGLNYNRRLAESWAQAVGWFVTSKFYNTTPQNTTTDVYNPESLQWMTLTKIKEQNEYYTPAFIDLIDNYNQPSNPNDFAKNYTLGELEETLAKCPKNWYSYRDKLAERTSNSTENQMLWIFNNYK
jgi:hypothetical protein